MSYTRCMYLVIFLRKKFPKRYRTNMFNLHQSYVESLQSVKDKITFNKVVKYVNTMEPALLMYCMNIDYNQNEINKKIITKKLD